MQLGSYSATLEGEDQHVAHSPQQLAAALKARQAKNEIEPSGELDEATGPSIGGVQLSANAIDVPPDDMPIGWLRQPARPRHCFVELER